MFEEEQEPEFEIFSALLFNSLKAITFMFFISFAMINKPADSGKVDPKAEMLITVTWPDSNPDDVDTYVEDPAGNVVWYNQREAGLMHMDRDDRGMFIDVILYNGKEVTSPLNQEIVSFRGLEDGEYVVNVVHYIANGTATLPVKVKAIPGFALSPHLRYSHQRGLPYRFDCLGRGCGFFNLSQGGCYFRYFANRLRRG